MSQVGVLQKLFLSRSYNLQSSKRVLNRTLTRDNLFTNITREYDAYEKVIESFRSILRKMITNTSFKFIIT